MIKDDEIKDLLLSEFEKIRSEIVQRYREKGMEASGEFERELTTEYEQYSGNFSTSLWGAKYTEQLQYGRRPSDKMPPMQALYDWIINKGIMDRTYKEYQIKGLAFAIAKKIQREGYNREKHGGVNLISEVINDDRFKLIIEKVGASIFPIFEAQLTTMIKQLEQ